MRKHGRLSSLHDAVSGPTCCQEPMWIEGPRGLTRVLLSGALVTSSRVCSGTINGPANVHPGRKGRRVYRVEAFLRSSGLGMGECVTRMSHHSPEMNT